MASPPAEAAGPDRGADTVLRTVFEALGGASGPDFVGRLLGALSRVLGADMVLVGRIDAARTRVAAVVLHAGAAAPVEVDYPLAGSPFARVLDTGPAVHPQGVAALFPEDRLLRERGFDACGGVPIRRRDGSVFALMAALSRTPFARPDLVADILGAFAARVGAELEAADHAAALTRSNEALRAATARAERSEMRLLGAIDSVPVGFAMFDADDRLVMANRTYRALYGELVPHLVPGTAFADLCRVVRSDLDTDGSRPGFDAWFAARMARHRAADGTPTAVSTYGGRRVMVSEIRMADGGIVSVHVDITEMAVMQDQLDAARRSAEEALAVRARFLANISHELRTPLNAVIGLSELLLSDDRTPLAPLQREHLAIIKQSGEFLLSLIVDILDMSRLEAGKMTVAREPVDLAGVVRDAVAMLALQATRKGLRLEATLAEHLPPVAAERRRVVQIVQNLLSNAIKFTDRGGIHVTLAAEGTGQRLAIADTGCGMSAEDIAYAMVPFQQSRRIDPSAVHEGTGLGLPLVKALVELMDGRLDIASTPGTGTTVAVWLPGAP